jgi:hypothetical protein
MSDPIRASRCRRLAGLALFALVLLALALFDRAARADLIILKDGFALQGKVRREGVTEFDPVEKVAVFIPKGFTLVDDGPRRIVFSPAQVRIVERMAEPAEERVTHVSKRPGRINPLKMKPLLGVVEATPWNSDWERDFYFRIPTNPKAGVVQHLYQITPYYASVEAVTKVFWACAYLTRELGPDTVEGLLRNHPSFREDDKKLKPAEVAARRMRKVDFYAQAGWFDLAEKELDRLLKDQPAQKARVTAARVSLEKMRAREGLEEVKRWHHAGRHAAVRKRLAAFPEKHAPPKVVADLRDLRSQYARTDKRLQEAARHLTDCAAQIKAGPHRPLAEAAAVIRGELHFENVERLDAFLGQAAQAERQAAAKHKPSYDAAHLLSLAVTGWLLGSPSAEARPDFALSLWRTRQMVLTYCRTADSVDRQRELAAYQKAVTPRVGLDEVAQLIPHLPPAEPARDVGAERPSEVKLGRGRAGATYHVKLPPEYTHNRPYPVLIVLHRAGERPADMLERWSEAAADHGYILAAPAWEQGLGGGYTYSEAEHDTVIHTLRDLRRRYRVDSDRVFLFGLEAGGQMAWDVGLSHPGLFAGILPMSASPNYFPARCWRNAQYLPIYAVSGGSSGDTARFLRERFEQFAGRHFPALWVDYKGRGQEWFAGEVPNLFDWMHRQRRAFPMRELGTDGGGGNFGNEFCTLRDGDNQFYWLTASNLHPRCSTTFTRWNRNAQPATVTARVDPDLNEVRFKVVGVRKVTILFGRNPKGNYMLDLDKPVTFKHGFGVIRPKKKVTPSLSVLLQELYKHGDREHLFVAKEEFIFR